MWWMWALLGLLLIVMVANQVALMRSTRGLKGSRVADAIRMVNIALVILAVGLAIWLGYGAVQAGGR